MKIPVLQPDGTIKDVELERQLRVIGVQIEYYCKEHFEKRCEELQKILYDLVRCGDNISITNLNTADWKPTTKCHHKDCNEPVCFAYMRGQRQ